MLNRAARNAYSWWWASHIRTKQSKWLDQNLHDMEEKVDYIMKMIDHDGDSFAQRAEMYYRKRPEILNFIEEYFKGYRALAERYDHLSRELQSANRTIASVCPEQIHLRMDDEDDPPPPTPPPQPPTDKMGSAIPNAPPQSPRKFRKMPSRLMSKKGFPVRPDKTEFSPVVSSGLTKEEALREIDSLQKTILGLQTEKEFIRSSYQRAASVCQEIEDKFTEMQRKVNNLQDEFGIGTFIEDDEARRLMVASAMNSCQESLTRVQQKQRKLSEEAIMEHRRIVLIGQKQSIHIKETDPEMERRELELLRKNIKTQMQDGSNTPVTMSELAEKLDELVEKVIVLESAVSSQNASVNRLRTEADELEVAIINGSPNLAGEFERIQLLDENVKTQNVNLQIHIIEASCSHDHLSDKLHTVKADEDDTMFMEVARASPSVKQKEKPVQLPHLSMEEKIINLMRPSSHHQQIQEVSLDKGDQWADFSENFDSHIILDPAEAKSNHTHHENVTQVEELSKEQDKEEEQEDENQQFYSPTGNRHENPIHDHELAKEQDKKHQEEEKQLFPHSSTAHHHENTIEFEEWFNEQDKKHKEEDKQQFPHSPTANHHENTIQVEEWFKEQDKKKQQEEDDKQQFPSCPAFNHHENTKEEQDNKKQFHSSPTTNHTDHKQSADEDEDDDPNWRELFLSGLQDREKNLLKEYTSVLRNFKEAKKKLNEIENKNRDSHFMTSMQIKDLKKENALKDAEIKSLHQKLVLLQSCMDETTDQKQDPEFPLVQEEEEEHQCIQSPPVEKEEDGKMLLADEPEPEPQPQPRSSISTIEEKFRTDIDGLLEENIEFWLRFSTSFHQITKFQTSVQDLQGEFLKIKKRLKQEGTNNKNQTTSSDLLPIYKHLQEIQTELALWVEHNSLLEDDLQNRVTSLGEIQQEIVRLSNSNEESTEEGGVAVELNGFQAAKFQGEVINMKQENNKVVHELQAGLDHVKELQVNISRTLSELEEAIGSKNHHGKGGSRTKIPLRSLLFGARLRKTKPSLFQCLTPTLQKQYSDLRSAPSPPSSPPTSSS